MNARRYCILIAVMLMLTVAEGFARDDRSVYQCAREAAASADQNSAFSFFHSLLRFGEASPYYDDALFAVGEYYFWNSDYGDSRTALTALLTCYPQGKAAPFAAAFLLRIDESSRPGFSSDDLRKKIITFKQLSLLFSEYKEYSYNSPLGNLYKAVYFIDRVEFYRNGELFETIIF